MGVFCYCRNLGGPLRVVERTRTFSPLCSRSSFHRSAPMSVLHTWDECGLFELGLGNISIYWYHDTRLDIVFLHIVISWYGVRLHFISSLSYYLSIYDYSSKTSLCKYVVKAPTVVSTILSWYRYQDIWFCPYRPALIWTKFSMQIMLQAHRYSPTCLRFFNLK